MIPLATHRRWMAAPSVLSICVAVALSSQVRAQASSQGAIAWGCDAPAGRTCYFGLIYARGGVRAFSLPAGRRMTVTGAVAGRDRYLVSIDAPNLGDLNRCRQLTAVGHPCQEKTVDAAYND